ncbi:SPFH domain-containing protein [Pseudoflavonifractor phocaeensis]|uniref:SPFH domain-containing protein n=1 Tax=Pseudoflavonifractor phocaeensis TaxID=1870988 RepID=UPI002108886B|nr:SPFH domain-containing protein [Pseudoflavonifractor phocaeensis]MCQ4865263.1 SPFH domain-containing protein [Pseudoflavonifractor phocaeensis]
MAIVEVVKYNGKPDVFAWKYPSEELGTWTQLIVNESQEAVLFKGGKALDVFTSGRHTLDTANIPLLNKVVNLPFGGRSPFTAEVWYVNRVNSLDVKWGTATPIQLQDPKYGVFVPVRSFGQFGVRIDDAKKFLVKLVGTLPQFDKSSLLRYFRGLFITKAKDTISSYLIHKEISALEINAYLDELSAYMKERIEPVMAEYGITLVNFYVNDINIPEDDPAVRKLKAALAKRAEMDIIGYNYQQERSFDTLEGAATNQGSAASGLMGAGLGLGMGVAAGGAVGGQFGGMANVLDTAAPGGECPQCHARVPAGKKFCPDCGCSLTKGGPEKGEEISCASCGTALTQKTKFCPECGKKYNPCPNCGADLPEGAGACAKCGADVPTLCPSCGKTIAEKKAKFCPECGARLQRTCPKCGKEVDGKQKFCPECGEKLKEGE